MQVGKQAKNRRAKTIAFSSARIRKDLQENSGKYLCASNIFSVQYTNEVWNQADQIIIHKLLPPVINFKHSFFPKKDVVS